MQPVEITLRYIVAAASLAIAAAALRLHGLVGALPAVLTAVLVLPSLDALLARLFPDPAGQEQPTPGQGVLRTAFSLLLTTLRVVLCFAGVLGSLYSIEHSAGRAALRLDHAPAIEYRSHVTLEGTASLPTLGVRGESSPRLQLNGQPVPLQAGRFATRQPLQMGLNTFRMVLDGPLGQKDKPRALEQTVVVRRVSEQEYDEETFGHSDCALTASSVRRSGAWDSDSPVSRFSGSAELHSARLRGRCVQDLTATRLPLQEQAAEVELRATLGRGRVKVLVRHPDGSFERLTLTPGQPLRYTGTVQLVPINSTVTHPGDPGDGAPPLTSIEEFWVAYVSLESLPQGDDADAGAGAGADHGAAAITEADAAFDLHFEARYSLK